MSPLSCWRPRITLGALATELTADQRQIAKIAQTASEESRAVAGITHALASIREISDKLRASVQKLAEG